MSAPLLKDDILFAQRFLSSAGLYSGKLDGKFNADLDKAETKFDKFFKKTASQLGSFDPRTEDAIRRCCRRHR